MTTELDYVRSFFLGRGYGVREVDFFGASGLMIFVDAGAPGVIQVAERATHVYPTDGGWEVRVTPHGGPHWVRKCINLSDATEALLFALEHFLPDSGWAKDPGAWRSS